MHKRHGTNQCGNKAGAAAVGGAKFGNLQAEQKKRGGGRYAELGNTIQETGWSVAETQNFYFNVGKRWW